MRIDLTACCGCPAWHDDYDSGVFHIDHIKNCQFYTEEAVVPTMTAHTKISFLKSGLRGIGYGMLALWVPALFWPMLVLVLSELIGVIEECVV